MWVTYGGRCYLVATEHCRQTVGEEEYMCRPQLNLALDLFNKAKDDLTYVNLSQQEAPKQHDDMVIDPDDDDVDMCLETARVETDDEYDADIQGRPPLDVKAFARQAGWHVDKLGNPILVTYDAWSFQTTVPRYKTSEFPYRTVWTWDGQEWNRPLTDQHWTALEDAHELLEKKPVSCMITRFSRRAGKQRTLEGEKLPEVVKQFRRDNHVYQVLSTRQGRFKNMSKAKLRKLMDKEIPYDSIPGEHRQLYDQAAAKEWASWLQYEGVEALSVNESHEIMKTRRHRVIGSRFVYRD